MAKMVPVRFYRAVPRSPEEAWDGPFPLQTVIPTLQNLDVTTGEADARLSASSVVSARVRNDEDPPHLVFYSLREEYIPEVELHGQITILNIDDEARIAEPTHACFFDDGVIGILAGQGPRSSAMARYLQAKTGLAVAYETLLRRNWFERLEATDQVRYLHLRISAGHIAAIEDSAPDMYTALRALSAYSGQGTIEIIMRATRQIDTRHDMASRAKGFFNRLRQDDLIDQFDKADLIGKADEGEQEVIDLLQDQLTITREIPVDTIRRVSDEVARVTIRSAYAAGYQEIRSALGATG